jgi:hypothetical protein
MKRLLLMAACAACVWLVSAPPCGAAYLYAWTTFPGGVQAVPAGSDYVAVAAGHGHSLAMRADGSIVGWGDNDVGQATPPRK